MEDNVHSRWDGVWWWTVSYLYLKSVLKRAENDTVHDLLVNKYRSPMLGNNKRGGSLYSGYTKQPLELSLI